jgi:hypothetical protein
MRVGDVSLVGPGHAAEDVPRDRVGRNRWVGLRIGGVGMGVLWRWRPCRATRWGGDVDRNAWHPKPYGSTVDAVHIDGAGSSVRTAPAVQPARVSRPRMPTMTVAAAAASRRPIRRGGRVDAMPSRCSEAHVRFPGCRPRPADRVECRVLGRRSRWPAGRSGRTARDGAAQLAGRRPAGRAGGSGVSAGRRRLLATSGSVALRTVSHIRPGDHLAVRGAERVERRVLRVYRGCRQVWP